MRLTILRATLVCISLLVGLGTAEFFVRRVAPQDLELAGPWYESHPVYRFRHYPNMDQLKRWGDAYYLRTNSHGLRADHDEPYESPLETRIVVHGDSVTFGVGVEYEDTFVQRTQEVLRHRMAGVDVLNLGVSAYGPDQEYLLFLEEGRKYSPRICVIAVCLENDLEDLTRPLTAFRLEGDRLVFIPYEPPVLKRLAEHKAYRWLANRSHLLILARSVLFDPPTDASVLAAQESQMPSLALALAIYRDFTNAIKHEHAIPVILLLPSKEQIAKRRMLPTEEPFMASVVLHDELIRFCAASGVLCVDALDTFARTEVPIDSLFIAGDAHYNAAGHKVVADALERPLAHVLESLAR